MHDSQKEEAVMVHSSREWSRLRRTTGVACGLLLAASLALLVIPPAQATLPLLTVTPSAKLSADRTTATITGTARCDPEEDGNFVVSSAQVFQVVGRVGVSASSRSVSVVPCTGAAEPFSIDVSTFFGGTLAPGRAGLGVSGSTDVTSQFVALNTVVRLTP